MTTPLRSAGPAPTRLPLAGLEFSPAELSTILAVIALVGLAILIYVAMFIAALVRTVEELHRTGRTRHPFVLLLVPPLALVFAVKIRTGVVGPLLGVAGLGFGYALMFYARRGWFRWTALPVLPLLLIELGSR